MGVRDRGRPVSDDELCRFIADFRSREGISPTVREIQRFMGVSSPSTAYSALKALQDQGRIRMSAKRARTIRLADDEGAERTAAWRSLKT